MRIAFVTHQFFPRYYTGVERLTLNLAVQLRRMGHDTVVVTAAEHSSDGAERYDYAGTPVRTIRAGAVDLARPWMQDSDVGKELGRVLDEEQVELVHVMHPMRFPQVFSESRRRGLPVVAHVADFGYLCARINLLRADGHLCGTAAHGQACASVCRIEAGPTRFGWGRETLEGADAVVYPCRATAQRFAAEGFDTQGWHYVPWGVDYALHRARLPAPGGESLVIGFIGTLLRQKGARVLVEAVRQLPGRKVELRLHGDSFHESAYEAELRDLAAGDARIRFEGGYSHEDFRDVLAPLDLVAIPSLWYENLPTSGLNAVAAGVPLLVSDVVGLTELVDDYRCGFAFPIGDAGALAAVLEELLTNPERLAEVRRTMAHPPSLEEEAWRMEQIYEGVAHEPGARSRRRRGRLVAA
jgi:glycosyltransferase involved in cell wall biosynthesis